MTLEAPTRAGCPYCSAHVLPNSSYCLDCGQIVQQTRSAPRQMVWTPPPAAGPSAGEDIDRVYRTELGVLPPAAPGTHSGTTSASNPAVPNSTGTAAPMRRREARESATTATGLVLSFSTGERVRIGGSAVIGRNPADVARNSGRQSVSIEDPTRSISRAHAFLDLDADGIRIRDAGSRNGSELERGGRRTRLDETPTPIADGDVLWLGEVGAVVSLHS